jgi:hypothetical protein
MDLGVCWNLELGEAQLLSESVDAGMLEELGACAVERGN